MNKNIVSTVKVVSLATMLALGVSYAFAWVGPTAQPPNDNVVPVTGGALPSGTSGQTLRNTGGTNWVVDGAIFNNGTNVGVGTAVPTSPLVVKGSSGASNDGVGVGGILRLSTGTGLGTNDSLIFGTHDGDYSWIQATKPGTGVRNLSLQQLGGNVGIGTTAPSYRLHVAGGPAYLASGIVAAPKNDAGVMASGSGFFETSAPVNYYTGASGWQHLIESRHTNDLNNYSLQIAGSFFDQNLYFRKTNNSAATAWSKFLATDTAGNLTVSGELNAVGGSGTNYVTAPIEVAMTSNPRISFHWPGVVASQLGMDSAGTIRTYDNPGTGYANFTAAGITATNRLTVSEAGGAYTYITLRDDESPNGVKYIHANSNVLGFLNGAGGWMSYWDNAGNQQNIGNINTNDVYLRATGKWMSTMGRTPLALTNTNGAFSWTRIVTSHPYTSNNTINNNWIALDANRPVLGIQVGTSINWGGSICVAGVSGYAMTGVTSSGYVSDLDLDTNWTGSVWSSAPNTMPISTLWIGGSIGGRYLGAQDYTDHLSIYNLPAGLKYIPEGKTLYYGQYSYPGSTSYCTIDVLYGDYY